MALQGKQMKETFGGDTFIFQHPGIQKALKIQDETRDEQGNRSSELLAKEFLEHVVFLDNEGMPQKITLEHFEKYDSMSVLTDVIKAASKFVFR